MNDHQKEYQRKYREANKEKRKAYMREWNKKQNSNYEYMQRMSLRAKARKQELRAFAESLRSMVGCRKCGDSHPGCLDFHHIDEKLKVVSVSKMCRQGRSRENILKEAEKCIVLCSSCHRKWHYEQKHGMIGGGLDEFLRQKCVVQPDQAVQALRDMAAVLEKHKGLL